MKTNLEWQLLAQRVWILFRISVLLLIVLTLLLILFTTTEKGFYLFSVIMIMYIVLHGLIKPVTDRQRMITLLDCILPFLLFIVKCLTNIKNWSKNILTISNEWDPALQRRRSTYLNNINHIYSYDERVLYKSIMTIESLVEAIKDADKNGEYKTEISTIETQIIPLTNLANEIRSIWRG